MTTRRNLVVAASTLAVAFTGIGHALAQTAQKPPKQGDFLFVQTARGMLSIRQRTTLFWRA